MAGSKPMQDQQRLAALCGQALGELEAERRAARGAAEKRRLGIQIAVMRELLARARKASGGTTAGGKSADGAG